MRLGSQRRAAEELHITESAVSRRLGALQAQLGVPLFTRAQRGLRANAAARVLAGAMQRSLADIDEALEAARGEPAPRLPSTRLRIAASPGIADCWLGSRLAGFCRAAPEVEPEVRVSRQGARELAAGRVDLAIQWEARAQGGLHGDLLMPVTEFPVCAPALLAWKATAFRAKALTIRSGPTRRTTNACRAGASTAKTEAAQAM